MILQSDLVLLKRTAALLAVDAGQSASLGAAFASETSGFYRAAQMFAVVPNQFIVSLTFVLFPMVSKAAASVITKRRNAISVPHFAWLFCSLCRSVLRSQERREV